MTSKRTTGDARTAVDAARCIGRRPERLRLALAIVVMAGITEAEPPHARRAWGQDDWDAGKRPVGRVEEERARAGGVMAPADFDRWVAGGRNPDQIKRTLESLLALRVESAARTCGLSVVQKEKLELAGHGDMQRLSRSVEQLKEKFRQVGQDQRKFAEIAHEVSQLQTKMQTDPYGDSSLYRKTLEQMLNRDQSARYQQDDLLRRKFRYEAKIEVVMSNLENVIPLRAEQRQRLVRLLLDETQPPKKFGQYDYYVVLYQMGMLGEAKVKPMFDDAQWEAVKKVLDQGRGLEHHLRSNGFLP